MEKPVDMASAAGKTAEENKVADGFEMLKKVEAEVKQKLKQTTLVDPEHYKKGLKDPIDAFELLVDPESFAQTVENIFAFSFLVKDGWASLKVDGEGVPKAASTVRPDSNVKETQAILAFNMNDWNRIKGTFEIQHGMLKVSLCYLSLLLEVIHVFHRLTYIFWPLSISMQHRTQGYEDEKKNV